MHGRSADTSLAEICQEMSELLDKQVNVQKESLKKYFQGSHKFQQSYEKVCDENERNKEKNNARVEMLLMEGSPL